RGKPARPSFFGRLRAGLYIRILNMLRFSTAGESHGEALVAVVSGLPAGLKIDAGFVDRDLWRRQQGYGRGGRMGIEPDTGELLLRQLEIEVLSHVIAVGSAHVESEIAWEQVAALARRDEILLNCADKQAEQRMKAEVDQALKTGDSVGGVFEVVAHNVPPGLGTYANWDERLDAQLAAAVMSLQA